MSEILPRRPAPGPEDEMDRLFRMVPRPAISAAQLARIEARLKRSLARPGHRRRTASWLRFSLAPTMFVVSVAMAALPADWLPHPLQRLGEMKARLHQMTRSRAPHARREPSPIPPFPSAPLPIDRPLPEAPANALPLIDPPLPQPTPIQLPSAESPRSGPPPTAPRTEPLPEVPLLPPVTVAAPAPAEPQPPPARARPSPPGVPAIRNCFDAMADLAGTLKEVNSDLKENALYQRSLCWQESGKEERAQADWREYLRLFPSGRFSRTVRERLQVPAP